MSGQVFPFPTSRIVNEPYLTKRQIADHYRMSTRWVELRVREGAPSELIGGRRRFKISAFDQWIQEHNR